MQTLIKPWYKKWWGIIFLLILTLLAIILTAFIFYILNLSKNIKSNNPSEISKNIIYYESEEQKKLIEGTNSYWIGSANPKITIVEFSDFNCPYCKNSYSKIRELSLKHKDKIKYIYRDFPVLENSDYLSLSAKCAGEQGLFWLMHDKLFQNQNNLDLNNVLKIANQIGANLLKFNNCINDNKYINDIKKDISDANLLDISQTPVWFINGYKISGDIPYDIFNKIINDLL